MPKSRKPHNPKNSEKSKGWGKTRHISDDPGADVTKIASRKEGGVMRVPKPSKRYCANCGFKSNFTKHNICVRCEHRQGDEPKGGYRK